MANSSGTISRRHSSPILNDWESTNSDPFVYTSTRRRSSLPPVPPTPTIEAKRLPSIPEPGKTSWRLSFTSPNRGEELRKLSQEHTGPSSMALEYFGVSPLPMRTWLHSQGLRSSSQGIMSSEDSTKIDSLASRTETCTVTEDFGGVDGGAEANGTIVHLHEMGISQRLASSFKGLQSSASSPQLSSWASHNRDGSSISGESRPFLTQRPRYLQHTSQDSEHLSQRIPQSWGKVLQDGTSSFYPSAVNSIKLSPQSSRYNLASLLAASKNNVDIADLTSKCQSIQGTQYINF